MNNSRRSFFVRAVGVVTFGLISSLVNAEERRRARPAAGSDKAGGATGPLANPWLDPKDQTAQALSYSEKHADVKKADLKVERNGVAFEKQKCNNCSFYSEVGTKEGTKAGNCTIFPGKLVKSEAWCTSWNKKA